MDRVFIIAEAGVNHNGKLELAERLVLAAAEAGADAVKFQTFNTAKLVSKSAESAAYQKENCADSVSQFELIKKLELKHSEFRTLRDFCGKTGIRFMTTPDEEESADFICGLVDVYKIGSGEVTNLPYLKHIARKGKPVILSTGMSTLGEVEKAVTAILGAFPKNMASSAFPPLTLLHCVTAYPAPPSDVNLRAMLTLKDAFSLPVGYSDHTEGVEIAAAAAALGATVIEKHFTLDKNMEGPDHKASLNPDELKALVRAVRNVEKAMGSPLKRPSPSEIDTVALVRKSAVAARDLKAGDILAASDIVLKRPGYGVAPEDLDKIIGMRLVKGADADTVITWEHLRG
jgi:N-acetylneuraminate synthase